MKENTKEVFKMKKSTVVSIAGGIYIGLIYVAGVWRGYKAGRELGKTEGYIDGINIVVDANIDALKKAGVLKQDEES
jgi:hypothetical protein